MSGLPDEVVARLSTHGAVRLEAGDGMAPASTRAVLAPLPRQLYALVSPSPAFGEALASTGLASFTAEDPEGEYLVRVRSRAALGRSVTGDKRRSELLYWVPEGWRPQETWAIRLYPEELDFAWGKGAARKRAAGPVPGGTLPGLVGRWGRLAREGVVAWYFLMLVLYWVGLLVLGVPEGTRVLVLVLMLLAGGAATAGMAILNQRWAWERYREGLVSDEQAQLVLEGWAAPADLVRVGIGGVLLCVVVAAMLAGGGGAALGGLTLFGSGLWIFGPFFGVRHLMRRKDREDE